MNVQQIGGYVSAAAEFLLLFFHSAPLVSVATFLAQVGAGLATGVGSFTVKVGNAVQVGQDIAGLGFLFGIFAFLRPAQPVVMAIGTALSTGAGSFGPIRVGSEAISGTVASNGDGSDTVTFTVGSWPA